MGRLTRVALIQLYIHVVQVLLQALRVVELVVTACCPIMILRLIMILLLFFLVPALSLQLLIELCCFPVRLVLKLAMV